MQTPSENSAIRATGVTEHFHASSLVKTANQGLFLSGEDLSLENSSIIYFSSDGIDWTSIGRKKGTIDRINLGYNNLVCINNKFEVGASIKSSLLISKIDEIQLDSKIVGSSEGLIHGVLYFGENRLMAFKDIDTLPGIQSFISSDNGESWIPSTKLSQYKVVESEMLTEHEGVVFGVVRKGFSESSRVVFIWNYHLDSFIEVNSFSEHGTIVGSQKNQSDIYIFCEQENVITVSLLDVEGGHKVISSFRIDEQEDELLSIRYVNKKLKCVTSSCSDDFLDGCDYYVKSYTQDGLTEKTFFTDDLLPYTYSGDKIYCFTKNQDLISVDLKH